MLISRARLPFLLLLICSLALTACGALDDAKQATKTAQAGLSTAEYLKSVQPQIQAYSQSISTLQTQPPHNPAQAAAMRTVSKKLRAVQGELRKIKAGDDYAAAHKDLIASVGETASVVDKLAGAAQENDTAGFNKILGDDYAKATTHFADAMQKATQPIQESMAPTGK